MSHHEDTRHTAKTKSLALLEKRPKRQGPKILEELPKEESIISIVVKRITKKRHLFFARWR